MTNAFKYSALGYVTGNVFETSQGERHFIDCRVTQNNFTSKLAEKGITPSTVYQIANEQTSNYLIYGTYTDNGTDYGYIVVLDQNGTVLKIITTYDTGTNLSPIVALNYDENGIYGLDRTNGKYRIILLNNVALNTPKGYFCKLRASYYVNLNYEPKSFRKGTCPIKKVPNDPTYILFGYANNKTTVIRFVNNVGMPNEWYQSFGHNIGNHQVYISDFLLETVGDATKAYIYYTTTEDYQTLFYEVYDGENLGSYESTPIGSQVFDIAMNGKKSVYFANRSAGYVLIWLHSTTDTLIAELATTGSSSSPYLFYKDNLLFAKVESSDTDLGKKYLSCIAYGNNILEFSDLYEADINEYLPTNFIVQKTFSLYRYIVQGVNQVEQPSIVIYDNMYSGSPYISYGSSSSQKGELYSNGYIVFARPLYNKQIFNNQTTSTLEIPNGYLNDIEIGDKNILSRTNTTITTDNSTIQKNIYETVFLNFTHTISVIDEDEETSYPTTANYINQNLNVGTQENYNDTHIGKLRINYPGYSITQNLTWEQIDNTHYQTKVAIDTTQIPFSMDFMSDDETTVYITKELDLEQNKVYVLTQKIRIE